MAMAEHPVEEHFDVLTKTGQKTGISKPRGAVHRDGDYHRAVHMWIFAESTQELLLQRRADCKDSWPGLWDISSAGHISAGDSALVTARRELHEELGVILPKDAFEPIFVFLQECVTNDGKFINNEFNDVYLITTLAPIPLEAFTLQESEVSAVKYISCVDYKSALASEDPEYVPYDINGQYGQLFDIIRKRYKENMKSRSLTLQKQLRCYAPISLNAELTGLTDADKETLGLLVKAATIIDEIFYLQVWYSNPILRDWLKQQADISELDKLKWMYYLINKSPWSCLDENESFLTTADSAVKLCAEATKPINGWKGLEYKAAFPMLKPPGANFYPPDMDKMEFELWKASLKEDQQQVVMGFFSVIKRHSEFILDSSLSKNTVGSTNHLVRSSHDLYSVPFSQEYKPFLTRAAELLHRAGDLTSSLSLKRLLHSKADAFLSNEYYDSDIAWMELDSKLDVTIGPYETYEDTLFGYKATFEAFIGVRDDNATAQLKLFGNHLQILEQNLPMDNMYKSEDVIAAPIRVIQLVYNAGDVKGPQTVAFNLPNDERIVKDRGTSMVMLKNVSEAKFTHILQPIADICIAREQQGLVDFESFFTHTICHECCHGIGPHTITLPGRAPERQIIYKNNALFTCPLSVYEREKLLIFLSGGRAPMASSVLKIFLLVSSISFSSTWAINSSTQLNLSSITSFCKSTPYPEVCFDSLKLSISINISPNILTYLLQTLQNAISEAQKLTDLFSTAAHSNNIIEKQRGSIQDCKELHQITLSSLQKSSSKVNAKKIPDARALLSAALTNKNTCLEGLDSATGPMKTTLVNSVVSAYKHVSNSLSAIPKQRKSPTRQSNLSKPHGRRLLGFPVWMTKKDRRILQTSGDDEDDGITVAADGTGDFTTVTDAINSAPNNSYDRVFIYVRQGVYQENVEIPSYKTNIVLLGDGASITVITGSRSVVDGWTTFRSATVAVSGDGFLARDITFENTAGPSKHQAVALRVNADLAALFRCTIKGYQDTLYVHSFRQFYRECDIYGTIDFIFGNAAAVFQASNIISRMPLPGQFTVITAQSRDTPDEDTGISIQNCSISAADDLLPNTNTVKSYLGRPWRIYSTTVFMESYIGDFIDPSGWTEWSGDLGLDTLYYGEYENYGPGSGTDNRVDWEGCHVMDYYDASYFTVAELLTGDEWLESTNFPYDDGI